MVFERKKIGDILVEMGAITPTEIQVLLERQELDGGLFGELGVQDGLIPEQMVAQALARQFYLPYLSLEDFIPDPELLELIPVAMMREHMMVPVRKEGGELLVAISDPTDLEARQGLEILLDLPVLLGISTASRINALLSMGGEAKGVLEEVSEDFKLQLVKETDKGEEVLSIEKVSADTSPIIRLIDSTLIDALNKRASDIHIEASAEGVIIKYRVDGVLFRATEPLDSCFQGPMISRIKVMSELDISERRIPQDGRFKVRLGNKAIDFRVSIMPSSFGEDAVIRILDKESIASDLRGLTLESLGIAKRETERLRRLTREPYGMVLVTGPTGSGKTTTLYAVLSEINSDQEKVITIEDPVEYQVSGVVQIPVNEKKGLTFARGLRSILRHDPDKIMVGEIRDPETAQIAVQSALTGHLVFTTVHANNVFDVLGRFLHMGLDPYNFVASLNCVVAQRLVRKICPHCKEPVTYGRNILEDSGLDFETYKGVSFYQGRGCSKCNALGYHGRSAIVELLIIDDQIRELIISRAPLFELKEAARKAGTVFLREAALEKVFEGESTLEEINRVTFVERRD